MISLFSKIMGKNKSLNGTILVLAEKYTVAESYAKAMQCNKKDRYFENEKYIITWTEGHVCTLYDPEDYDNKYKVWNAEDLPIVPNGFWIKVRKETKKKKQFFLIKELISREDVKAVFIGTDSGREGNLIGEYILMAIENEKPVYRLWINAMNFAEIISGFASVKPMSEYKNLSLAAEARDEIDWLIGYNFSRIYSLIDKKTHSVGRTKTVVLNLIYEREKAIENFKAESYYEIYALFKNKSFSYEGRLISNRINSKAAADKLVNKINQCEGTVIKMEKEMKNIPAPSLYNLNDLLRVVNRRYGYTAGHILEICQKLYEDYKIISYPRTDSRYIRKSMISNIPELFECNNFGKFKAHIYSIKNINHFVIKCVDDSKAEEHTAIVPLYVKNLNSIYDELNTEEKNVFDEIVFNFLAAFKEDYKYETTGIVTKVKDYLFSTKSKKVIDMGWKAIYRDNVYGTNLDIKEGDISRVEEVNIENKITRPQERYTDDTLLEVMENPGRFIEDKNLKRILREKGIGTNATRAQIIKDLELEYVIRDKKYILPTKEGKELIELIKIDELKQPYFTAEIEQDLDKIYDGTLNKDILVMKIIDFIRKNIDELKELYDLKPRKKSFIGICPVCNKGKIVKAAEKGYGCTELKNSGCKFFISNNILGTKINEKEVLNLITKLETNTLDFKGKRGCFKAKIILKGNKTEFKYM